MFRARWWSNEPPLRPLDPRLDRGDDEGDAALEPAAREIGSDEAREGHATTGERRVSAPAHADEPIVVETPHDAACGRPSEDPEVARLVDSRIVENIVSPPTFQ